MSNILVVAAHPDDEVLGCGGSIARYADEGNTIGVLFLGDGVTSRPDTGLKQMEARKEQARKVAKILGIKNVWFEGLHDNRFDAHPLLELVYRIEERINEIAPVMIFTHSKADVNIDHRRTFEAVLAAARPKPGSCVKALYSFEIPSSTDYAFGKLSPFVPNLFIDITTTLDKKLAALRCYQDELCQFPHPRSEVAVSSLAELRGSSVGIEAAEAFELVYGVV